MPAVTMCKAVKTCLVISALQVALGFRKQAANKRLSVEANWSRAEVVQNLGSVYHGGLKGWTYDPEKDGLIWSGTSRAPSHVFQYGFRKSHYAGTEKDMGEDVNAWAQQIQDSITKNTRSYGFHFTTSPKVAAQFGVLHAQQEKFRPEFDCDDEFDDDCIRERMEDMQQKFGCPAEDSTIWKKEDCWGGKQCIRVDKLSDPSEGLESLCPNWGYAYVVKAEGLHVRVQASHAFGKDYSSEEEVYVPIGVEGEEVLGAIPIYGRKAYDEYHMKNPGLINFETNWNGPWGWKSGKMAVPAIHTKDGKGSDNGIGAFIYNPNYKGDARAEVEIELVRKRIVEDLGTAIPKEAP